MIGSFWACARYPVYDQGSCDRLYELKEAARPTVPAFPLVFAFERHHKICIL